MHIAAKNQFWDLLLRRFANISCEESIWSFPSGPRVPRSGYQADASELDLLSWNG